LSTGEWCDDDEVLHNEAVTFFQNLFSIGNDVQGTFPISGYFPTIPFEDMQCLDHDVSLNGNWNWPLLYHLLRPEAIPYILNFPAPSVISGPDRCVWNCGNRGIFSVRSVYTQLVQNTWAAKDVKWQALWHLPIQERIKYFLWLASHGKLLTNLTRYNRRLTNDPICSICGTAEESILHVLRDCADTAHLWSLVLPPQFSQRFFNMDLFEPESMFTTARNKHSLALLLRFSLLASLETSELLHFYGYSDSEYGCSPY
ncbi:hypothetical protein V6N12_018918, partial [Hibiscus sabdariffa]